MINFAYIHGVGWRAILAPSIEIFGIRISYFYVLPVRVGLQLMALTTAAVVALMAAPYVWSNMPSETEVRYAADSAWRSIKTGFTTVLATLAWPFTTLAAMFIGTSPQSPVRSEASQPILVAHSSSNVQNTSQQDVMAGPSMTSQYGMRVQRSGVVSEDIPETANIDYTVPGLSVAF